jgi:hypothetical protein
VTSGLVTSQDCRTRRPAPLTGPYPGGDHGADAVVDDEVGAQGACHARLTHRGRWAVYGSGSGRDDGEGVDRRWHRDGVTVLAHDLQVAGDRFTHQDDAFLVGGSGGNTAQEVGAPCAETTSLVTVNDDDVSAHCWVLPIPACLRMLFSVIGRNVSLGLPATVAVPGLVGWR